MGAGIGAVGNTVAVDVEVAPEIAALVQHLSGHHLAAVVLPRVIPLQRTAQPMIHADIEIEHDKDGGLQAVGEIERLGREFEGFGGVFRKQHHVLGVAMGSIGAGDDVALLGARRHAGRWTGALHVHDHGRYFREIRQPDKFRHQRDAGAGSCGEGARAVP